jgi:hypothetical protein
MIRDLTLALKAILTQAGLPDELRAAHLSFERPSEPFGPSETTLNLYLYDIRENAELRQNEPLVERANGIVTLRKPPLRVSCSYLVTAWPAVVGEELALQEHRLLSQALWVLSRYPSIPRNFLQGSLQGQDSLPMMTAQADGLKNPAEFWTALGNRLKPSLTLTVTLAMETLAPETFPMVITEEVRLGERTSPEEEKIKPSTLAGWFRIGGKVTGSDQRPVPGAVAVLVEINRTAVTDGEGGFRIGPIPPGTYTLKVTKEASSVTRSIAVPAPAGNDYNVQLA